MTDLHLLSSFSFPNGMVFAPPSPDSFFQDGFSSFPRYEPVAYYTSCFFLSLILLNT